MLHASLCIVASTLSWYSIFILEVFYDKLKKRSPFSVLRSPFSVLRYVTCSLTLLCLVAILCSCPPGESNPALGSITVEHLPNNFALGLCEVNPDPAFQKTTAIIEGSIFEHPKDQDKWYETCIGTSTYEGRSSNKLFIGGTSFHNTEEHGWQPDSSYGSTSFTYTGWASVRLAVQTAPDASHYFIINNVRFNNGHAVIDYPTPTFTLPATSGRFTLTDIPSDHNGKYAILVGAYGNPPTALYGLYNATSVTAFKGYPIANGNVEIPMFKLRSGDITFSSFDEDASVTGLVIIIQDNENFDFLEYSKGLTSNPPAIPPSLVYTSAIQFSGGKAAAPFTDGQPTGGLE